MVTNRLNGVPYVAVKVSRPPAHPAPEQARPDIVVLPLLTVTLETPEMLVAQLVALPVLNEPKMLCGPADLCAVVPL